MRFTGHSFQWPKRLEDPFKHSRIRKLYNFSGQKSKIIDKSESIKPSWKSLLYFTTENQYKYLAIAIILSILTGLVVPFQAFFLGKLFLALTSFGAGVVDSKHLIEEITKYSIYLCTLGAGSWVVSTLYFASWLFFGELQGKNARLQLFQSLLDKNMTWYDSQKNGIRAAIPGIQM